MAGRIGVGPRDFNNPDRSIDGGRVIGVGPANFAAYSRAEDGLSFVPDVNGDLTPDGDVIPFNPHFYTSTTFLLALV